MIFISSPTKAVSVPWITSFKRIFTTITAQPPSGPIKKPANNAGSSATSKRRNPGAKGSGILTIINIVESAPSIPINAAAFGLFFHFIPISSCIRDSKKELRSKWILQSSFIFSYPDYTVGHEISPYQPSGSRTLPPVGTFTPPWRSIMFISLYPPGWMTQNSYGGLPEKSAMTPCGSSR